MNVSDSGPIISLARIDHLEILQRLFGQIHITQGVHDEIDHSGHQSLNLKSISWICIEPDPKVIPIEVHRLGRGEATSISLCLEKSASILLIDDRLARVIAEKSNIQCMGTLRILKMAKDHRIIDAARPLLEALVLKDFRVSKALQATFLKDIGE